MSGFAPFIYILALTACGWALSLPLPQVPRERKWIGAIMAVTLVPLLFLLPALWRRDGQFADLQWIIGITTLVWGAAALGFGWGGALLLRWWRERG